MHFRLYSTVGDLTIVPFADFEVDVAGVQGVVLLRQVNGDGSTRDASDTDTTGDVRTIVVTGFEYEVSPALEDVLVTFARGQIPHGWQYPSQWVIYDDGPVFHSDGFAITGSMPRLFLFPEEMQRTLEKLERAATDAGRRIVDLIRWRTGKLAGSHTAVDLMRFEWTVDGRHWFPVPCDASAIEDERRGVILNLSVITDVQEMVALDVDIPFAHVLLREAWELRLANPRSAILLGVAAAELGFKATIGSLVPDAGFLAERLMLPPLADLMKHLVPLLPVKLQFNDAKPSIPKRVRGVIAQGVEHRNALAHRPVGATTLVEELRFENVTKLLTAVHDLLLLLDFYCGRAWAASLLSNRTRAALGLKPLPSPEETFPTTFVSSRRRLTLLMPELAAEEKTDSEMGEADIRWATIPEALWP